MAVLDGHAHEIQRTDGHDNVSRVGSRSFLPLAGVKHSISASKQVDTANGYRWTEVLRDRRVRTVLPCAYICRALTDGSLGAAAGGEEDARTLGGTVSQEQARCGRDVNNNHRQPRPVGGARPAAQECHVNRHQALDARVHVTPGPSGAGNGRQQTQEHTLATAETSDVVSTSCWQSVGDEGLDFQDAAPVPLVLACTSVEQSASAVQG